MVPPNPASNRAAVVAESAPTTLDDAPLSWFHLRLAVYTGGGPFLDGYILAIIGVAMIQLSPQLQLTAAIEGVVGAVALVGIFIGAGVGGYLTDRFGRQKLYNWDLIAIAVLSIAHFWIGDAVTLIVMRLLIGIALGADYPIASSLLTEFTPKRYRGPFIGSLIAAFFAGGVAAYLVGELLLMTGDDAWRWMLASGAAPALLLGILRYGTPESPRWLANQGRTDEAAAVMTKVFGPGVVLPTEQEQTSNVGIRELFKSGYTTRLVFVTTFWTCAIIPVFAISVFGPKILAGLNLDGVASTVGSAAIQAIFLVGCIIALLLVNRMGRRSMLIHSFLWSGAALLVIGLFPDVPALWIAVLFTVYAVAAGGNQILTWVYPSELFPTHIRGAAVGLTSALSRIGAAIGTVLVPLSLANLGTSVTMLIATAITAVGFVVSLIWAPETRGLDLSDAASLPSN
ncbi:MFS transporter [Rhodococcus pseudokoreensis]|uniref:MFS transporter n=1 Tax=Rhodococcus pseudokoreensis TaxID=2811421 RepID=A0A974W4H5_9NOCA|nr:MFS transporter [Rhodococcus pseudokoreensis]QSE90530.1 MFS transporter [Rhodococcus pseudokoreensis]